MVAGADERAARAQRGLGRGEVLDRRDLPGQVVQPGRVRRRARALADREQAEVVVVGRAAGPEEHGPAGGIGLDDLEAEGLV